MNTVPGTNIKYDGEGSVFERFSPFISATDGLSLSQICSVTGLEPFMVQNWVKRGFVPHPINKKYGRRHLARILLITCLRDAMPLERIGTLLTYVNGDTDDESDDIITEEQLFDAFCLSLKRYTESPNRTPDDSIEQTLASMKVDDAETVSKLRSALSVMLYGYISGAYKRMSEDAFEQLSR